MNTETFNTVVERRCELIKSVLVSKAEEYSSDTDRLHNFKRAAELSSKPITWEQALLGMLRKHLVSVIDMIDAGGVPPKAMRDEKVGDSINYHILLEALWDEREEVINM